MANIGTLAVQITASADQFSSTLEKVAKQIDRFGNRVGRFKDSVAGVFESIAEKASGLLRAIPVVGGAFAALPTTGAGFLAWLREGQKEIVALNREARRLNVTTEALAGLQLLAGGASEALERGLFKLSKQLGDAASGGEEAQSLFGSLGLDFLELSSLPLDKALGVISDKFMSLGSASERSYLAFQLFGKTGFEILPVLSRGSAAIDEMAAKAKGLGLSFNRFDAAAVLRAERAFAQLDAALKGIQRQAAIAFAPLLGAAAEWADKLFENENGFREFWDKAAKWTAAGAAKILGVLDEMIVAIRKTIKELAADLSDPTGAKSVFPAISMLPTAVTIALRYKLGSEVKATDKPAERGPLADLVDKLNNPQQWIDEAANAMKAFGSESLFASRQAEEFAKQQAKLADAAEKLQESLTAQVQAFGESGEAARIWQLQQQGASDAMLAGPRALVKQLDSLKEYDELIKKSFEVIKDSETPLEAFQSKLEDFRRLEKEGLIDATTYAREVTKAFNTAAPKDYSANAPAALEQGSAAAISAINRFERSESRQRQDPAVRVAEGITRLIEQARIQEVDARRTADAIERIFVRDI